MPQIEVITGCEYSCDPYSDIDDLCEDCRILKETGQISDKGFIFNIVIL